MRMDGSGRPMVQKEVETYNRVFQRHMESSAEDLARQEEHQKALLKAQSNFDYQLQHENQYNLITLKDKKLAKLTAHTREDKALDNKAC